MPSHQFFSHAVAQPQGSLIRTRLSPFPVSECTQMHVWFTSIAASACGKVSTMVAFHGSTESAASTYYTPSCIPISAITSPPGQPHKHECTRRCALCSGAGTRRRSSPATALVRTSCASGSIPPWSRYKVVSQPCRQPLHCCSLSACPLLQPLPPAHASTVHYSSCCDPTACALAHLNNIQCVCMACIRLRNGADGWP